jgi:hypothetical protein
MSIRADETNYWPGYVDALINVVLNLLFLTSVFAVGFVSLNADLFAAAQKIAEAKAREIMALRDGLVLQDHDAPPRVPVPVRPVVVLSARSPSAPLPLSPAPTPPQEQQVRVYELRFLSSQPERAGRVAVAAGTASFDTSNSLELGRQRAKQSTDYPDRLSGLHVLGKVVFAQQQFDLPHNQVPPALDSSDSAVGWTLLVMTDKDNPRLMREAFERLTAVRASYIRSGQDAHKFQMQIKSTSSELADGIGSDQVVWVLKSQSVKPVVSAPQ